MKKNSGSILIVASLAMSGTIFGGTMLYKRDACFNEWRGRVAAVKWDTIDGCMIREAGDKVWVKAKNYVGR